ncbi:hypothetical protein Bca52824_085267 [Brassica carinata]|uniref:Uncharacterized protein n=1 Tax=Brassica carinata TaxID=52824 RepID=A0A8X7TL41_BRACI|nr:hypothetical protein Bca52824_085267 [Brassica carinata]
MVGGNDDDGGDKPDDNTDLAKVETGGSSQQTARMREQSQMKEKRSPFRQTFTITRIFKERERVSLPDFTDIGGNDDDGGDKPDDNTDLAKVETGGSSQQTAPDAGTVPNGKKPKTPLAEAASKAVKKARMA